MIDPLTEMVTLLQPLPSFSKVVSGAGSWRVRRSEPGRPFYCVILAGSCRLVVDERGPIVLREGDFVLVPSARDFSLSSLDVTETDDIETVPVQLPSGEFRLGEQGVPPDVRHLVGYCTFGSPDADLLVSLLPRLVLVRGDERLSTIVGLVVDEFRAERPAREVVLARLLEVLLIEAFRSTSAGPRSPGLLSGLADERLAAVLREMHGRPAHGWTVERLAKRAALSRSAFYDRFSHALGIAPMAYLFVLRMALAKRLLRGDGGANVAGVAERVGYGSASAFSVAFARHVGVPPATYAGRRARS